MYIRKERIKAFWEKYGFSVEYSPKHYCGSSGFGLSVTDRCPACCGDVGTVFNGIPFIVNPYGERVESYPDIKLDNLIEYAAPTLTYFSLIHPEYPSYKRLWLCEARTTNRTVMFSDTMPDIAAFLALEDV